MMNMGKYFAYCDEQGFDTFDTAEQAKAAANESIEGFRGAGDWAEETENIRWGKVLEQSTGYDTGQIIKFNGEDVEAVDYELRSVESDDQEMQLVSNKAIAYLFTHHRAAYDEFYKLL